MNTLILHKFNEKYSSGFKNLIRSVEHAGKSAILALDYITGNLSQETEIIPYKNSTQNILRVKV